MKKHPIFYTLRIAFPYTLPVLMGFGCLGLTYGILMRTQGYGALWSLLFSASCFCGSMQFIALTLLSTAFRPIDAFVMAFLVNARHIFYGLSMLVPFKGLGKTKSAIVFLLCDETFSILSTITPPKEIPKKDFYLTVALLDYSYWVLASFIGGLIGEALPFDTTGLDFSLTALIFVLFLEQWSNPNNRADAIIGVTVTIVFLLLLGPDQFLFPSMGMLLVVLWLKGRLDANIIHN